MVAIDESEADVDEFEADVGVVDVDTAAVLLDDSEADAAVVGVDPAAVLLDEVKSIPMGVVAPSWLPGIADPTPELVHGVGIGNSDVSGLSAGS